MTSEHSAALARALGGRTSGDGWVARCPAHDDREPSLSITSGDDGTVLVHCHAGCTQLAVIEALRRRGLWPDHADRGAAPESGRRTGARAKANGGAKSMTSVFQYRDGEGRAVYEVVRKDRPDGSKSIYQRRINANGSTTPGMKGVELVPYRLPELISGIAAAERVFVAEGERKVDLLARWGLTATCNSGGAGKWQASFSAYFASGRVEVVILPDNDDPGRAHALQVAANLFPVATGIRILELPGLPLGGDVVDWAEHGGSKEALLSIVDATLAWSPPGPAHESEAQVADLLGAQWSSGLILKGNGEPRACLANAITALREHPACAGRFAFDLFAQRSVAQGRAPWMSADADRELESKDDIFAANWLQHNGILVSTEVASQALEAVARGREFHPVRAYLESLTWDEQPRLVNWLTTYLGVPDTAYVSAVGRCWLVSGVARVYQPGCKADSILILEGAQGIYKSKALAVLFEPWFTDDMPDLGTKDASFSMAGRWGFELAELESLERASADRIKAFLSRSVDRFRPPYGRRMVVLPRQCIFAGTANGDTYLRDPTGGRRFWPVKCGNIDVKALAEARDQLWAGAREFYLNDTPWWLDDSALVGLAGMQQAARLEPDPWDVLIDDYVRNKVSVSIQEVLRDALRISQDKWGQREQNRIARHLRKRGWERYQDYAFVDRPWRYRRSATAAPLAPIE